MPLSQGSRGPFLLYLTARYERIAAAPVISMSDLIWAFEYQIIGSMRLISTGVLGRR